MSSTMSQDDIGVDTTGDAHRVGPAEVTTFAPLGSIAVGGGSTMDAAKLMWLWYENPTASFDDMKEKVLDRPRTRACSSWPTCSAPDAGRLPPLPRLRAGPLRPHLVLNIRCRPRSG
ncbi:hypothetical protein [Krasilnikovia sp. M28-CT-15]|uniref:hypothetical protein n=1 Tax=Krasilnikovia sp. M28-CT-15 TaxID=3373540 RepID=UPI00399CD3AC